MSDHNGDSRHGRDHICENVLESWPVTYEVSRKHLVNQFSGMVTATPTLEPRTAAISG
jgi:hypothetical protein